VFAITAGVYVSRLKREAKKKVIVAAEIRISTSVGGNVSF
jgi:hypothetical protein